MKVHPRVRALGDFFVPERGTKVLRQTGKVKWFNENKGYGFILQDGGGRDVFVHYSEIKEEGYRTLSEGEMVEFDVAESPKGPQAKEVVRNTDKPAPPPA
jgi:CspA family cold shock protein